LPTEFERRIRRTVDSFDRSADAAFSRVRGHKVADSVFYTASDLGDFSFIWVALGLARAMKPGPDRKAGGRLVVSAAVESLVVNSVVKSCFKRTRPDQGFDRPRALRRPRSSSFPSGHATSAFSSAVVLGEDDPLAPLYLLLACVVSLSRVHVKIHHASDVVAGALLGTVFGVAVRRIFPLSPRGGQ